MQRKNQKLGDFAPMYLRLPRDIKARLEDRAAHDGVSQAALVVDILRAELDHIEDNERVRGWLASL